jgi:hypothetical protein
MYPRIVAPSSLTQETPWNYGAASQDPRMFNPLSPNEQRNLEEEQRKLEEDEWYYSHTGRSLLPTFQLPYTTLLTRQRNMFTENPILPSPQTLYEGVSRGYKHAVKELLTSYNWLVEDVKKAQRIARENNDYEMYDILSNNTPWLREYNANLVRRVSAARRSPGRATAEAAEAAEAAVARRNAAVARRAAIRNESLQIQRLASQRSRSGLPPLPTPPRTQRTSPQRLPTRAPSMSAATLRSMTLRRRLAGATDSSL